MTLATSYICNDRFTESTKKAPCPVLAIFSYRKGG